MENGRKKQWIVSVFAFFFVLLFVLSAVDLSRWLEPASMEGPSPIQVAAPAAVRIPEPNPILSRDNREALAGVGKLDPSLAEGYSEAPPASLEEPEAAFLSHPFSVLIGSFRHRKNADQVMNAYREKGYPVYRAETSSDGRRGWVRVLAGCFVNLESAQDFIRTQSLEGAVPLKTRYANFIGSFRGSEQLREEIQRLSASGYSPYFIQDDSGRCRLYTGAFETQAEAEAQAAGLAQSGISCRPGIR